MLADQTMMTKCHTCMFKVLANDDHDASMKTSKTCSVFTEREWPLATFCIVLISKPGQPEPFILSQKRNLVSPLAPKLMKSVSLLFIYTFSGKAFFPRQFQRIQTKG